MNKIVSIVFLLSGFSLVLAKSINNKEIEILRDGGKVEKTDMEVAENGAVFLHKFGRGKRSIEDLDNFEDVDIYINPLVSRNRRSSPKKDDMETAENGAVFLHKFGRGKRSVPSFENVNYENIEEISNNPINSRNKRSSSKKDDMETAENGAVFLHKFGRGKRSVPSFENVNLEDIEEISNYPINSRNRRSSPKKDDMETAENGAVFLHKFGRGKRSVPSFENVNFEDIEEISNYPINSRNRRSSSKKDDMETAENGAVFLHKFGRGKRSIPSFENVNFEDIEQFSNNPINSRNRRSSPKKDDMETAENGAVFLHKFGRGKRSLSEENNLHFEEDFEEYYQPRNKRSASKKEEMDTAETVFFPSFSRNSYGRRRFGRSVEENPNKPNFEEKNNNDDSTVEIDTAETVFLPSFSRHSGRNRF